MPKPVIWVLSTLFLLITGTMAAAQQLVPIAGNHLSNVPFARELAAAQELQGEVQMALINRAQLAQLEADLQDRDSPLYHQWLTPEQFAERFGPTPAQMEAVADWLSSEGLQVTAVDQLQRAVRFTASYSAIKAALQVKVVGEGTRYANLNDPMVPADLAPTIVSIEGLTNRGGQPVSGDSIVSTCSSIGGWAPCNDAPSFGPADLYTFYDETPVLQSGNLGSGGAQSASDCIAVIEGASINTGALSLFTSQFATALPSPAVMPTITLNQAPTSTATPGLPGDNEPYLDIEWAHAVSPNTPIRNYYTNSNGYLGAVEQAVTENLCGAISSSTEGGCEPESTVVALDGWEAQAVAQGQTFFKSAGDFGSNWTCGQILATPTAAPTAAFPMPTAVMQKNCGTSPYQDSNGYTYQPSIDEEAASPNITTVGGTQFQPAYSSPPDQVDISTVNQGLEEAWNAEAQPSATPTPGAENCPIKDSGGGGYSQVFNKPPWQSGLGVPNDGARDIPDVSMGANGMIAGAPPSAVMPGFFVATLQGPNSRFNTCSPNNQPCFTLTAGTSIATPMWAGISRLIAQAQGVTRLGNINNRLYELAAVEYTHPGSNLGLHDVTSGNNGDGGIPGYSAGPGYDLATGLGSPDIAKLVAAFPGAEATFNPANTTVNAGASAGAGSFTVFNTTSGPLTLNSVTIDLSLPAIFLQLTLTATVGSGAPLVTVAASQASTVFSFSTPPTIPSGGSVTLMLTGSTGALAGAGWTTAGEGAEGGPGTFVALWLACLTLALAASLRSGSHRRSAYVLSCAMLLSGLAFAVIDCSSSGGSSGPSPSASAIPSVTPTPGQSQTSGQMVPQGGISMADGQGGIVEVSGMPGKLGTVTVQY
ncbi:MAG TPA: S53 family serine peptidase [Candidatus Binataceae bacterium]|nr:S53 family serine peptidase [Candidatus Binataceae bacterium]